MLWLKGSTCTLCTGFSLFLCYHYLPSFAVCSRGSRRPPREPSEQQATKKLLTAGTVLFLSLCLHYKTPRQCQFSRIPWKTEPPHFFNKISLHILQRRMWFTKKSPLSSAAQTIFCSLNLATARCQSTNWVLVCCQRPPHVKQPGGSHTSPPWAENSAHPWKLK